MSHRITIARPVVNIKASRRHRNPPSARQNEIQVDIARNADTSLLEDYENRLINLAKSRNSGFSLSMASSSLALFLAVCLAKRLKIMHFYVRKFRYPSLIVATICSSVAFSLLCFPFFTLAALISTGTLIKYGRLVPVAARHVSRVTNARLSCLEASLNNRTEPLRISFEQNTRRIIDELEQRQRDSNMNLLHKANPNLSPEFMESSTIPSIDPELGQLTPHNNHPEQTSQELHYFPFPPENQPPEKDIRSQQLSILRDLRPDSNLDLELNRLRLIPQFDAEGWLLVTNPGPDPDPDVHSRFSEELKSTRVADISSSDSNNERWKRMSL